ncbi:MAG: alanine racemase [Lachnospiraceae bacterium]|nr:alanine racemase [Lachnospiraceae bacterium]
MTEEKLRTAISELKTPFYLYDTDVFRQEIRFLQDNLSPACGLTYSMKANPFLVGAALDLVERIEVCSYGEFLICKSLGIAADRLLISGVLKKREDIAEIVRYCGEGALYTAESPLQAEYLNEEASVQNLTLNVLPRFTSGNQFGMDQDTILALFVDQDSYANLRWYGLHFFSGTGKKNLKKVKKELDLIDSVMQKIEEKTGRMPGMLEYGTGLMVPYFEGEERMVSSEEGLSELKSLLCEMKYSGRITVEMGRAIAWNSGTYVTRVLDRKTSGKKNYCITDGGIHQLNYDGQMLGMYVPKLDVIPSSLGNVEPAAETQEIPSQTICGSLCTARDVLVADYRGSEIKLGDYIAFHNVGAYSIHEGISMLLSHEFPGIAFYNKKDGIRIVRAQAESYQMNMATFVD